MLRLPISVPLTLRSIRTPLLLAGLIISATALTATAQARPARPATDLTTLDLEQLLQLEVVFAASKRNQNPREVASVVTVVTAGEITKNGYRTLADILRTVPSFYVTYDRNYSYVGVRGFAQPGDYSSRVLLLVDGLRTNDNVYDMAYVGEEFLIDIPLIDRVEVVRGPSGAIYGNSAFFAVINVVTKTGAAVGGSEFSASAGSFGAYTGRATFGKELANGLDVLFSASVTEAAGKSRLYFAEFDTPATNNGVAENMDGEGSLKLLGKLSRGPLAFSISHSSREKQIPTASYSTLFNDARSRTTDQTSLASLVYERASELGSISTRLHAGVSHYDGDYAFSAARPNFDRVDGKWAGLDVDASRVAFTRHVITTGFEYRNNFQQDQVNYDPEPFLSYTDSRFRSQRLGAFAQDEIRLTRRIILYAGVRQDWFETFGTATSPRLGLIITPDSATTVKLLYGNAFRAPNEWELHHGSWGAYKPNLDLGAERIQTTEIAVERTLGGAFRINGSVFQNRIKDLIAFTRDTTDDRLSFQNRGRIDSKGAELGLGWNGGRGLSGKASYAWQRTADRETGVTLTNSPRHMAELQLYAPLYGELLQVGLDAQYVGARKTISGGEAQAFSVTNLTLLAPKLRPNLDFSVTAYNLFNAAYGYPGSEEHMQDVIQQDGRTFRLKLTFQY